jgi:hypothetical protein
MFYSGPQDAASYLTQVQSRASATTRSPSPSRSASLISYASTITRPRAESSSAGSDATSFDSVRSSTWRGLNSPMPLPSSVSATRAPTTAFDVDFVPNPEDPYSLRHSEYGYDINPAHRTISKHTPGASLRASDEEPSVWIYLGTYISCECGNWSPLEQGGRGADLFAEFRRAAHRYRAHARLHRQVDVPLRVLSSSTKQREILSLLPRSSTPLTEDPIG